MQNIEYTMMRRALQLAACGELTCAPNPMVGAVVAGPDGRILGEGYHHRAGEPHAEVVALNAVSRSDARLLPQSTLYVSLEPCAHFGRTPPCAALIVRRRVGRCVVGCRDPFSRVDGQGLEMMRQGGVEVVMAPADIQQECLWLNRRFVCRHRLGRPFITLKWAQTADGYIGRRDSRLIVSTPLSRLHAHRLRATHQAILIGHGTLRSDRPALTLRHWAGHTPRPYVLGRTGEDELPQGFQAFAHIDDLLHTMQREGLQSLLVEGGAQVLQSFIERDLWDEVWAEISPLSLPEGAQGVEAPAMPQEFQPQHITSFQSHYLHWQSPLLKSLYGLTPHDAPPEPPSL